ncbi:VTC domain-containing protein, partial [Candidatus Bipolaricaulota bacterium]|nr:VTC domain-containing protein [Candidatus Bipolaricaulota bacterium]
MTLGRYSSVHRYELKHVLRPEVAERVVDFLAPHLEMDEHCRGRDSNSYTVRSIYFDSPDF